MSTESVRQRLQEAASPVWREGNGNGEIWNKEHWDALAVVHDHAVVDLALALDVIEVATIVSELGRKGLPSDGALTRFDVALAAFEAAP